MNSVRRRLLILALFCLSLLMQPAPAFAQGYSSQLTFLENFAIRVYERGDVEQAKKEFQRILKIDPQSAIAKKYLAQIDKGVDPTAKPAASITSKTDTIAQDIKSLRQNVVDYERDLNMTESLIRNLITENDHLYMALDKRSREVMELREKAYGIRYADQYKTVMNEMPPERVPQNLHRAEDILPSLYKTSAAGKADNALETLNATSADIENLEAEIAKQEQDLQDFIAKGTDGRSAAQFQRILSEKRDALLEKNLALNAKRDQLAALKDDLMVINTDLKSANNRYLELIDKIDQYYRSIKAEISARNYVEQKIYSDLILDYARKSQEVERLKNSSAAPSMPAAAAPTPSAPAETAASAQAEAQRFHDLMTAYETTAKELSSLKASIAKRDAALVQYKTPLAAENDKLVSIDEDMADKDRQLAELRAQLDYADKTLGSVNQQAKSIQSLLKDSDRQLAGLSQEVEQIKGLIKDPPKPSLPSSKVTDDQSAAVKALEQRIAELELKIGAKDETILNLEERLSAKDDELQNLQNVTEASLRKPITITPTAETAEINRLQNEIADLTLKLNEHKNELLRTSATTENDMRIAQKDLEKRTLKIQERELALESLKKDFNERSLALADTGSQVAVLEEKIASLETMNAALKAVTVKRDAELAKATEAFDKLKKENAAMQTSVKDLERDSKKSTQDLKECRTEISSADKSNNLLRKDLKTAQELIRSRDKDIATVDRLKNQLADRDQVIADLQDRLSQKCAETSTSKK